MPWMHVKSRGIQLISLKWTSQSHLVIISIGLTRVTKKLSLGTAPCKA